MKQIIVENELSNSKKAELVKDILRLLVKEHLSINQMTEVLENAQQEAKKIPITVSYNQND